MAGVARMAAAGLMVGLGACSGGGTPPRARAPTPVAVTTAPQTAPSATPTRTATAATAAAAATATAERAGPPTLGLEGERLTLPAGRSVVQVELPTERFVTVGLFGPAEALLDFQVAGVEELGEVGAHASLKDDGLLPVFVSVATDDERATLTVTTEAAEPLELVRASVDPTELAGPSRRALKLGTAQPRPIIGLPLPLEPRAGYVLQAPSRYQFLRIDIAVALRKAMMQTRIRFKGNPIAIGDGSQWDGLGPGTDRDDGMHIGHRGGSEVDIGLPSTDKSPSIIERRCEGVMVEQDELRCDPGTVRNVDARRLAYFLGLLIDGPTPRGIYMAEKRPGPIAIVHSILTDEAYVDEIRAAAEKLRRRHWMHDDAHGALVEEGLLRPSPWHTDHVHLRFGQEPGRVVLKPGS